MEDEILAETLKNYIDLKFSELKDEFNEVIQTNQSVLKNTREDLNDKYDKSIELYNESRQCYIDYCKWAKSQTIKNQDRFEKHEKVLEGYLENFNKLLKEKL